VQALNVNPTVAVKLSDAVSIGVGANWQHLTADLGQNVAYGTLAFAGAAQALAGLPAPVQQALLAGVQAQLGPSGLATEGPVLISGDSNAWGWNAGALVKLGEQAHLGVSYRSKVKHTVEGTATFTGAPALLETGPTAQIGTTINANFATGPVTTAIDRPDTLSVAAAWKGDKLELLADWTRTGWESIQALDIVRTGGTELSSVDLRFQNTWRAGIGAALELNDKWTPTARRGCPTTIGSGSPPASSGASTRSCGSTRATRAS
jgi:long-chain fatty acid transport protein